MRTQQASTPSQTTSSLVSFINYWAQVRESRHVVCEALTNWGTPVKARLNELVSLPRNWDGYYGKPVLFENANFALNILEKICDPNHEAPEIIPGSSGDLQLEWHTTQGDLELHIIAPNNVKAWYSVLGANPEERELNLTFEFSKVAEILGIISEAPIAAVEPAA